MRQLVFCLLLATVAFLPFNEAMRKQSAAVKGRLHCGDKPASGVKVKLIDKDTGLDPDDEMAKGYTDADGRFALQGDETELSTIDVQLKIYHQCNNPVNVFNIPDIYVSEGVNPKKVFDLGDVNLEVEVEGESHDCIN